MRDRTLVMVPLLVGLSGAAVVAPVEPYPGLAVGIGALGCLPGLCLSHQSLRSRVDTPTRREGLMEGALQAIVFLILAGVIFAPIRRSAPAWFIPVIAALVLGVWRAFASPVEPD